MTDNIEVHATDEHSQHITRTIVGDPPATDHTVIATAELGHLRQRAEQAEAALARVHHLEEVYARSSATSHNAHSRIVYGIVRDDMRAILNGGYGDDITARALNGETP